mgnify:CR=1 FL=1|jgi:hypothetical protein
MTSPLRSDHVALSLRKATLGTHNKGYEVQLLQSFNPNCSLQSQLLISLNVIRNNLSFFQYGNQGTTKQSIQSIFR